MYQDGETLSRPKEGFLGLLITHKGIGTCSGTVVHACKKQGRTVEDSISVFANGYAVKSEGFSANVNGADVVRNARRKKGQPYDLFNDNCEHLVNEALGYGKNSQQLFGWALAGGFLLVGILLLKK